MPKPEERARQEIDRLLTAAGWAVQNVGSANLAAAVGVAIREEPAIITKHVYRITVNRKMAIPDYVAIAIRGSREVRAQLMDSVQAQTRPGLNGGLIKKIRMPVPPLAYRQSIIAEVDRRLSIVRGVEAEVGANVKRAQALRQTVLARASSGEPLSAETAPHSPATVANAA